LLISALAFVLFLIQFKFKAMKQVDHLYIVLFRGNANNSSNAGFSYANSNYVPSNSNANISSHLCFSKIISYYKMITLPLGKKQQIQKSTSKIKLNVLNLINKLNDISDKDYKQNICSWLGWTKYSNSRHLLKTIIKPKYYGSIL